MPLNNKKVLVTGADGFIGSHLTEMLVKEGCQIKALSLYNSFNYWGWLEDLNCLHEIEVLNGDIRDPHFCYNIVKDLDVIFHLAALISIPYSYIAPDSFVDTNIKGTLNICQAALKNGIQHIIHTSTSEVYGTAQYIPIDENHPLQPQSPYSASKIGADSMAMSFYHAYALPVSIARPFNTYGPRQSARAVIPTIITQIVKGNKEIHLGDLRPTRDFNYVEDICSGFIAMAESENTVGETINLGTNSEISIEKLFFLIRDIMKSDAELTMDEQRKRPESSEVYRLCCNNQKAKDLLNYEPKYTLEEGLKNTIAWFSQPENLKKYKTEIYNV
jgi:NAD dependent epimerase/dehydratase